MTNANDIELTFLVIAYRLIHYTSRNEYRVMERIPMIRYSKVQYGVLLVFLAGRLI